MPGRALAEVPYDPYLVFVFRPEEALRSMRLWTAGYNFYAPRVPVMTHADAESAKAEERHVERAPELAGCKARAGTRAKFLLGRIPLDQVDPAFRAGLERYGVGAVRSLATFYAQAGLDVTGKSATPPCPTAVSSATGGPTHAQLTRDSDVTSAVPADNPAGNPMEGFDPGPSDIDSLEWPEKVDAKNMGFAMALLGLSTQDWHSGDMHRHAGGECAKAGKTDKNFGCFVRGMLDFDCRLRPAAGLPKRHL